MRKNLSLILKLEIRLIRVMDYQIFKAKTMYNAVKTSLQYLCTVNFLCVRYGSLKIRVFHRGNVKWGIVTSIAGIVGYLFSNLPSNNSGNASTLQSAKTFGNYLLNKFSSNEVEEKCLKCQVQKL